MLGLSQRLKHEAEEEGKHSPGHTNVHAGFGDPISRHVELLACADHLDLRVVCVPEMFRTVTIHHTGNLGSCSAVFHQGKQTYMTSGLIKSRFCFLGSFS